MCVSHMSAGEDNRLCCLTLDAVSDSLPPSMQRQGKRLYNCETSVPQGATHQREEVRQREIDVYIYIYIYRMRDPVQSIVIKLFGLILWDCSVPAMSSHLAMSERLYC